MTRVTVTRPALPPGYVDAPTGFVSWEYVAQRLAEAKNYWLASTRPDGRPHVVPRWGVFLDDKFYYDGSPETRHAINIGANPHVTLHLESGDQAIIADGTSAPAGKPSAALAERLSAAFCAKYEPHGYAPKPDQWNEGGLFVFSPRQILAWTVFFENPTKFVIEE